MRITCTWNTNRNEETKVSFSQDFDDHLRMEKLDFLQDAIGELTKKYEEELKNREHIA